MKKTLLTLLVLVSSTNSYAKETALGAGSSGGGFAVVCRDERGSINSAELLDLFEAKNKFHYELLETTGSLEGDYVASVRNTYRLQGYGDDAIINEGTRKNLDNFMNRVVFLSKTQTLPNLYDLGEHSKAPNGCEIEPLAIWYGNGSDPVIKIRSEIWDNLSSLDQAALVQHEIFYNYERTLSEKTSEGTRAIVASIFSTSAPPTLDAHTKNLKFGFANQKNNDGLSLITAFTHERVKDKLSINLTTLMGRPIVTKAVAEIDVSGVNFVQKILNNQVVIIALTEKMSVARVKVQTQQRNDWEIEFTFIPNKPVKIGFFQKGVLMQESLLSSL